MTQLIDHTNLTSLWSYDEATGTRVDLLGNHDMTATNAPGNATGLLGMALQCVGASNQAVSAADHADFDPVAGQSFTIATWFKSVSGWTVARGVLGKRTNVSAGATLEYQLIVSALGSLSWAVRANGVNVAVTLANGSIVDDVWYSAVMGYDGANARIFLSLNGANYSFTAAAGALNASTSPLWFGRSGSNGTSAGAWYGLIDQSAFARRMWSQAEAVAWHNGGNALTYPFLRPSESVRQMNGGMYELTGGLAI